LLLKYIFHVSVLYLSGTNSAYFTYVTFPAIILLSTPLHFYNILFFFFSDQLRHNLIVFTLGVLG